MTSNKPMIRPTVVRAREDHGFFGPDSVTWRVWGYPTALTIGFQRSVVIEELDPFLLAAVAEQNGVRYDPKGRYDRTIHYFATIAFGDSRSAIHASEILMRVHAKATGIEPISGLPYSANDPTSQLWILVTGWHSVLYAYEKFGPGPLSKADEERYWAECAIAAEMQTCDPADVPRTREAVRAYYAEVRSRLCVSEDTQALMAHLLNPQAVMTAPHRVFTPLTWLAGRFISAATIASMPRWMRRLSGFDQPRVVDIAIVPIMKIVMRSATPVPVAKRVLDQISPSVRAVVEPALWGNEPLNPVVVTPAEARDMYGQNPSRGPRRAAVSGV